MQGFVREDLIAAHPQGDANAEGRIDSDLRRQGYTAVSVRAGDTVRDIARRNGLAEHEIRDVVVLNSRHQLVDPDLIYPGDAVYLPPRP